MKSAFAERVALHDLLVGSTVNVRFFEHQVVQPAAQGGRAGRWSRAGWPQAFDGLVELVAQLCGALERCAGQFIRSRQFGQQRVLAQGREIVEVAQRAFDQHAQLGVALSSRIINRLGRRRAFAQHLVDRLAHVGQGANLIGLTHDPIAELAKSSVKPVSAKTGVGIAESFVELAQTIRRRQL